MEETPIEDPAAIAERRKGKLSRRAVKTVLASVSAAGLPIHAIEIDADNTVRILTTEPARDPEDRSALENWRASRAAARDA
jgi:hypothetical protein